MIRDKFPTGGVAQRLGVDGESVHFATFAQLIQLDDANSPTSGYQRQANIAATCWCEPLRAGGRDNLLYLEVSAAQRNVYAVQRDICSSSRTTLLQARKH